MWTVFLFFFGSKCSDDLFGIDRLFNVDGLILFNTYSTLIQCSVAFVYQCRLFQTKNNWNNNPGFNKSY